MGQEVIMGSNKKIISLSHSFFIFDIERGQSDG